ncbi:MAG TPA: PAS domain-containing protein, partial [Longimicrobium sp.]|nr:PAS domain-containing protein [Longimicrobium sp.]
MDPLSPSASASPALTVPLAGGDDALAAALEALEAERAARERAEAALRESQRRMAEVESLAQLGSWEQAVGEPLDRQPIRWSGEQLRLHGFEGDYRPATFGDFLDRVHPDDRQPLADACAAAVQSGDSAGIGYRVARADGQLRWLYARALLVRDAQGQPLRLVGTSQDVTEHHLAEAALRERERTLDEVEHLGDLGTWEWHLPTDTITWSREQLRIHGVDPATRSQTF